MKNDIKKVSLAALSVFLVSPLCVIAQETKIEGSISENYWPMAQYDEKIPDVKSVLGYDFGEKITTVNDGIKYLQALQKAAPDRIILKDYGKTWQNRPLVYAIIGAPEQIKNLESIKANSRELAFPLNLSNSKKTEIIENQPTIVWLTNSVHGDEISPADASLRMAYYLLAAKPNTQIDAIRKNILTVIVPFQNPDGRERFIASNSAATGLNPDPFELAAERDQPWPGGRMNHYNFDLNRDWFALTQPETKGQTAAMLEFYPQLVVDAHEMSRDANFFFPPEADPINPMHSKEQRALRALIGQNNAKWFDKFGLSYFTRDVFDGFYPGYGDSWPTSQGAIAMTYEQGSARGLVAKGKNGDFLTYKDTVRNHFVASLSTLEAAANNRKRILTSFYDFRLSAIEEGAKSGAKAYLIPTQIDQSGADKLAANLAAQGIEVNSSKSAFSACGINYGAGTYIVPTAQPAYRLVKNLLEKDIPLEEEFAKRQLKRLEKGQKDEIYDVTGWSLTLQYNLDVKTCNNLPSINTDKIGGDFVSIGKIEKPDATVGYVAQSSSTAFNRFVAKALNQGLKLRAIEEGFTVEGKTYPSGSVIVLKSENNETAIAKAKQIARESGENLIGIDTSWVTNGPNFGSMKSLNLKAPKIAIAWDFPTDPYNAGNARFVIERKIGFNVTPLRVSKLKSPALNAFDVLVLPNGGNYAEFLGEAGIRNLKSFMQNGGTIISLGGATKFLASQAAGVFATSVETVKTEYKPEKAGLIKDDKEYISAITPETDAPIELDGAILKAKLTEEHWLTQGVKKELYFTYFGSNVYKPLSRENGDNPIVFANADEVAASGMVFESNKQILANKPVVMVTQYGGGMAIGFTADPIYRAHSDGLDGLILNALIHSTARAEKNN